MVLINTSKFDNKIVRVVRLILLVVSYYRNWDTLQLDRALGSNLN